MRNVLVASSRAILASSYLMSSWLLVACCEAAPAVVTSSQVPAVTGEPSMLGPEDALRVGARAYFAGQDDLAMAALSRAMEFAPTSPLPYYLRGLTYDRQGDHAAAANDLRQGAKQEVQLDQDPADLSRVLSRVQGAARVKLEQFRRQGRQQVELERRAMFRQARRAAFEQREQQVLRTSYQLPLSALASRLTPDQAQAVAITSQQVAEPIAASRQTIPPDGSADAVQPADVTLPDNPFADDPVPATADPARRDQAPTGGLGTLIWGVSRIMAASANQGGPWGGMNPAPLGLPGPSAPVAPGKMPPAADRLAPEEDPFGDLDTADDSFHFDDPFAQ